MDNSEVEVGDTIQINSGPGLPKSLEGAYFKVESKEEGSIKLSRPYKDSELKHPIHVR